jgi:osmotically inducible protein OsmC
MTNQDPQLHVGSRQVLGSRLRILRLSRGLRLADVTAMSGVSEPFLSRIESGQRWPSLPTLLTLAATYGVDAAALIQKPAAVGGIAVHQATAVWVGDENDGCGQMAKDGFVVDYDRGSRLSSSEERELAGKMLGSPEELIGMAFAGCFSMSLAAQLGAAGFSPKRIETAAEVRLDVGMQEVAITEIHLTCEAEVDGIERSRFDEIAGITTRSCVVSRALAAVKVTLDSRLKQPLVAT